MATIYVNGRNGRVTTTNPVGAGQTLITSSYPEGMAFRMLVQLLKQLSDAFLDRPEDADRFVMQINIG